MATPDPVVFFVEYLASTNFYRPFLTAVCQLCAFKLKPDAPLWEYRKSSAFAEPSIFLCIPVNSAMDNSAEGSVSAAEAVSRSQQPVSEVQAEHAMNQEVKRLTFLLELTEQLQATEIDGLKSVAQFALCYLVKEMGAAFGDVKVIDGDAGDRHAATLVNEVSAQFVATHGEPAIQAMEEVLAQGLPYGQGLLWQVVETKQPLFVEDYALQAQAVAAFKHPSIGQLGIFPIPSAKGEIIGILTLESRCQRLQDAPQQDLLAAANRLLGMTIERLQNQAKLQQSNQELERASRLKSEFLASMSHELRTPLNSILGFTSLLKRQAKDRLEARQLGFLDTIKRSGQHLLQLIDEILDLSKIEAGKLELNLQAVNLNELCQTCIEMVRPRAEMKRIQLTYEVDSRLQPLLADERRINQILLNLLSNAIKFTPQQGQIRLNARLSYEAATEIAADSRPDPSAIANQLPYLCLEVIDSGIGIPSDRQHQLFRPFQQINAELSREHEGTGLGLSLTKQLAELHGGTVSLHSLEGQGSTFRIWIPLHEAVYVNSAAQPLQASNIQTQSPDLQSAKSLQPPLILVLEDQPFNQQLMQELLEPEGYQVEIIDDGEKMLHRLDALEGEVVSAIALPDLILVDIQLPKVDGLTLLGRLKASDLWRKVPAIAITAMAMPEDRAKCLEAGADAYLSKPMDLDELLNLIEAMLSKAN